MTQTQTPNSAPTDWATDDWWFDLRGFLVRQGALSQSQLADLNTAFDQFPPLTTGEWVGNSQRRDYTPETGYELHNCLEFSEAFDPLIDHPAWVSHAQRYAGEKDSYTEGVFIDECIATKRIAGGHHPVHSGGRRAAMRTQYHYSNGVFPCGQLNVLIALNDIGPGDGPTAGGKLAIARQCTPPDSHHAHQLRSIELSARQ
jgi:hypothetical protein